LNFSNKLHKFFVPILGDSASRRLILNYCARVNKPPQHLTQNDLPEIGKYFAENVHVFVGVHQAKQVVEIMSKMNG
jgi:hypothetical protein